MDTLYGAMILKRYTTIKTKTTTKKTHCKLNRQDSDKTAPLAQSFSPTTWPKGRNLRPPHIIQTDRQTDSTDRRTELNPLLRMRTEEHNMKETVALSLCRL